MRARHQAGKLRALFRHPITVIIRLRWESVDFWPVILIRGGSTSHNTGAGRMTAEMTYRMGALSALADWSLRVDYLGYGLPDGNAAELAFSPVLMIPEATSKFPVYFGIGAGPGIFVQQVSQQSSICMNYQIFGGLRFYDVLENTGFFVEAGLKNNFPFDLPRPI